MTDQVNIPLLRKAVEWAEAEAAKPEIDREWFQGSWRSEPGHRVYTLADGQWHRLSEQNEEDIVAHCGTAYCIAGYVAQSIDERYATDVRPEGMPHVAAFAADALGIECHDFLGPERGHLFYGENTIADVRRIAETLAGERL